MKRNAIAINTMEIPTDQGPVPEWVQLIPAGAVIGRDGRSWNNSQPEEIVASFVVLARDLPIDIEHATELKGPRGNPAPAVGWIQELTVRNGEIWGRAEWNEQGKSLVGERAYRYLSPVIVYDRASGRIVGVTSVGLTNQPNLKLPALNQSQSNEGADGPEESIMLKALLAALALPETATEAEALAKITGLKSDLATAANRAENPSLEKFVPRADYDAALARATNAETAINTIKSEQLENDITTAIDAALQEGKITPATADYHRAQCRQEGGLTRFADFCKAAPVIAGDSGLDGKSADGSGKALNAEEKKVCAALGISEEAYLKAI
jgi:phage I-like protein